MDKLKIFLAVVKKYQFWFLCGAAILVAAVCAWLAISDLSEQYRQQTTKIDGDFKNAVIQPGHPNQGIIDKVHAQHDDLKRNIFAAWETLYKEQKEKNPFPTEVLGEPFRKRFEKLKPQGELAFRDRERYQNFIRDYLPKLREIVKVRHPIDDKTPGRPAAGAHAAPEMPRPGAEMPRGMGDIGVPGGPTAGLDANIEMVGLVDWNESDYDKLLKRFDWPQTPSTLTVVMAQEDLWVYLALLRVIQNTNQGAANQSNAAVKRIDLLEIGKDAISTWRTSASPIFSGSKPGAAGPVGPGMSDALAGTALGNLGALPGQGVSAAGSEEQVKRDLMESRYIDEKGNPLPYQADYPYVKHPFAEFKMMPVCISLVIDQRKLPKFLVECANSNMPIEVRRVRLLKGQVTTTSGGDMAAGGMPGTRAGPSPVESMGPVGSQDAGQYEVPVEIHAIIYIYNPPDKGKLGTGAAAKSGEAPAPATPPAAPAVPPAAPAAPPAAPAAPPAAPATPPAAPATPAANPGKMP
jgi:hypothetical protein